MSEEAFIYEAIRTPRGKQRNGSLNEVKPLNLVVGLVDELRRRFPDAHIKQAHLALNGTGHRLELFEYVSPAGQPVRSRNCDPGNTHLAFLVENRRKYETALRKGAGR